MFLHQHFVNISYIVEVEVLPASFPSSIFPYPQWFLNTSRPYFPVEFTSTTTSHLRKNYASRAFPTRNRLTIVSAML